MVAGGAAKGWGGGGIGGDKEGEPNPHPVALCFPDTKNPKRQLHSSFLWIRYFRTFSSPARIRVKLLRDNNV